MKKTLAKEAKKDIGTDYDIRNSGRDVEQKYCGALSVKGIANVPFMERKSETAAAHPRAASCGASKAPPHENGTR